MADPLIAELRAQGLDDDQIVRRLIVEGVVATESQGFLLLNVDAGNGGDLVTVER